MDMSPRASRSALVALAITLVTAGCDSPTVPLYEVAQRQALWTDREPDAYAFEVLRSCFCGTEVTDTVTVTVRNGTVESRVFTTSGIPVEDVLAQWGVDIEALFPDIDGMFAVLVETARRDPDVLEVRYHPTYAFPRLISADISRNIADEEFTLQVLAFRVLP